MTDEEFEKLARKHGTMEPTGKPMEWWLIIDPIEFGRAVAAAARREALEEAAKVVDDLVLDHPGRADLTAIQCAAAIRARAGEAT